MAVRRKHLEIQEGKNIQKKINIIFHNQHFRAHV